MNLRKRSPPKCDDDASTSCASSNSGPGARRHGAAALFVGDSRRRHQVAPVVTRSSLSIPVPRFAPPYGAIPAHPGSLMARAAQEGHGWSGYATASREGVSLN